MVSLLEYVADWCLIYSACTFALISGGIAVSCFVRWLFPRGPNSV